MPAAANQYESTPTPSHAFAALRTPPPAEEPMGMVLRRGEAGALSNVERTRAINARLNGLR